MRIELHGKDGEPQTFDIPDDLDIGELAEALCDWKGWVQCEECGRLVEDNCGTPHNWIEVDDRKLCRACATAALAGAEQGEEPPSESDITAPAEQGR